MAKVAVTKNMVGVEWLALIQLVLAYEWLQSGLGKFSKPDFMDGISNTLQAFGSPKNPNQAYVSFLNDTAVPNAELFGNLVRLTEVVGGSLLLVGAYLLWRGRVSKVVAGILALACLALAFLNLNFYLASGFTSPSTAGINLVMGLTELVLGAFYIKQFVSRSR